MQRVFLRCSHDDDNDFIETPDPEGSWIRAYEVQRLADLARDLAESALRDMRPNAYQTNLAAAILKELTTPQTGGDDHGH